MTHATCATKPKFEKDVSDCGACASGRIDYPLCEQCTDDAHCSGHGTASANDDQSKCTCTCSAGYRGAMCSVCDANYIAGNNGDCVLCNSADHCNGKAASVTSDSAGLVCLCSCENSWTGGQCQTCPTGYVEPACSDCADGYYRLTPAVPCQQCDNQIHCSGNALTVSSNGDKTSCTCSCKQGFTGDCSTCSTGYEGADCDVCKDGYVLSNGACRACTSTDCGSNGHPTGSAADRLTCTCSCDQKWGGDLCGTCPEKYNATANCATCANGRYNYPLCDLCSDVKCAGTHGTASVSNDGKSCVCTCNDYWNQPDCATCATKYDATTCSQCSDNHVGTPPNCVECTRNTHCSGSHHSTSVVKENGECKCTCANFWEGADCSVCPASYTGVDCDTCVYPNCVKCTTEKNCSGHATEVLSTATECHCTCRNKWEGDDCDVCPPEFDAALDCNECATGYAWSRGGCVQCNVDTHCSSHASEVSTRADHSACVCKCTGSWYGDNCASCPANFNAETCASCLNEDDTFPQCRPILPGACSPNHCSNNGEVLDDGFACTCDCDFQWEGDTCNYCPVQLLGRQLQRVRDRIHRRVPRVLGDVQRVDALLGQRQLCVCHRQCHVAVPVRLQGTLDGRLVRDVPLQRPDGLHIVHERYGRRHELWVHGGRRTVTARELHQCRTDSVCAHARLASGRVPAAARAPQATTRTRIARSVPLAMSATLPARRVMLTSTAMAAAPCRPTPTRLRACAPATTSSRVTTARHALLRTEASTATSAQSAPLVHLPQGAHPAATDTGRLSRTQEHAEHACAM